MAAVRGRPAPQPSHETLSQAPTIALTAFSTHKQNGRQVRPRPLGPSSRGARRPGPPGCTAPARRSTRQSDPEQELRVHVAELRELRHDDVPPSGGQVVQRFRFGNEPLQRGRPDERRSRLVERRARSVILLPRHDHSTRGPKRPRVLCHPDEFARLLASRSGECDTYARFRLDVRIARSGEGDGATRARAVAHIFVVLSSCDRARSSVGERLLHTQEVAGSKPAAPTSKGS